MMTYPLTEAIEYGHLDAIYMLLDYGAKVNGVDLIVAFEQSIDEDVVRLLMDHNDTYIHDNMMCNAIQKYSASICLNLLHRASPEWWNKCYENPLHNVASSHHYALVEPFVAYGIDINGNTRNRCIGYLHGIVIPSQCTSLHIAVSHKNVDMIRELLIHGADKTIRDCLGHTPIYITIKFIDDMDRDDVDLPIMKEILTLLSDG